LEVKNCQHLNNAVYWLEKAANQGYSSAQFLLGVCYRNGYGIPERNAKLAVKLFYQAATQGHPGAQCNLGLCYYHGDGVDKDINNSLEWLLQASEQGYELANHFVNTLLASNFQ